MDKEFKDAEEYYRQTRLVETKNWSLQMALNFADEYLQVKLKLLGIADVVWRSEQFCDKCDNGFIWDEIGWSATPCECKKNKQN